ncbi:transcriptional regulator [Fischerella thermalis CCMEE 5198]|jgi:DNA-binding response OmpR family regulator/HPt (histidine-containing phosphotransfer) domain-containing protein|uniref:response regulator n=1 Tax=Fischerella thermalis TaxID=372787 RepID=UPI000C7FDB16|nr:response regulator [Fischerella thermalis]PMB02314.1 transcriptional regulator [Fischerella thermalis CCMEE 5196]PMB25832.1 transcriptional regulator [Fischerella thermalis CCMEE 5198]PMB52541.1 transcriptional regulator [Fischerella thermalis CCMEE 5201]
MRLLLVEDDECIANTLENILGNQHYVVDVANDGELGWELVEAFKYDLILLDVMLPKLDGIQLCQRLRSHNYQAPVLLLTAQNSSTHKVMGLDAGADDYLVKPFDMSELLARIRVLLRRRNSTLQTVLEWENLRLDPGKCEVVYNNHLLNLTPKEYRLLELFLRNGHQVFSRGDILEHLWSTEEAPQEDTVTAHIKGLRQKLKQAGAENNFIETVYGLGYRLKVPTSSKKLPQKTKENHRLNGVKPSKKQQIKDLFYEAQDLHDNIQQTKAALTKLWEKLKVKNCDRIIILEQATEALLENNLGDELRQQAQQAAHKLAGALGIFGFTKGSRLAFEVEQMLRSHMNTNQNQVLHLYNLVIALKQEIQQPAFAELEKILCHDVLDDAIE